MYKTMERLLCAGLAGLAVAAVAACSSPTVSAPPVSHMGGAPTGATPAGVAPSVVGQATPSGSNASVPNASVSYCQRAPSSMIHDTLGLAVGKQVPVIDGPVAVCAYSGKYEVVVRFQINENAGQFAQDEKSTKSGLHQTVAAVTGLGDGAFSATITGKSSAGNTLAARKGTVAVFISSPASLTSERVLMTRLLAGL